MVMQTNKWQKKYQPYQFAVDLADRHWPNKVLQAPPIWCSVDLRDGNQALVNPMNLQQKLKLFQGLLNIGFKEIEVGFPAAAEVEYHFLRELIEKQLIPLDVSIQVLTQAREGLINRTVDSLKGCHSAIFHLYNSTSLAQRDMVFKMTKGQIKDIALQGVRWTKEALKDQHLNVTLQYSPESFTGTETEFALEVCESVVDEWNSEKPVIINLPSTVELSTPNVFADQIEWFLRKFSNTDRIILSVHNHNDRGTGVAASELAMLAGAQRVEGTLFGNGERTGNVDIVTLALNMFSQGVETNLDFSRINNVMREVEYCNQLPVHPRHPYAGDLVFTAF